MLQIIFYTILAILVLSFFGISLQNIVNSPTGQSNFGFVGNILFSIYDFIVNVVTAIVSWFTHLIPH